MHITQRALKNPTLRLIALAFDMVSAASLETLFAGFNNVVVLSVPSPGTIDFDQFILLLNSALPKA